ncbi:MAG: hypothetical protein A3C55_00015 [Gammaproteobacteria bacterium RIFCSPHIGHO2_02_FULL_42_13]|nr:MAG: hypothetical protein A3C55_00015 [Gammaproteobacteria bacterium RIFCSPHIGHO2_02_FULL_42_13]
MAVQSQDITDARSTPEAKAARLKRLRKLTNLERVDVAAKYGINVSTLKGWETARAHGLSKKGANRFLKISAQEGVLCSYEWLMYGLGHGPRILEKFDTTLEINPSSDHNEEEEIIEELQLFRHHHRNTVDLIVEDDGMSPYYAIGDYVAGAKLAKQYFSKLINTDCIVQTTDGQLLLRKVKKGPRQNTFTLSCINPNTTVAEPVLYNVELVGAAPIIWHRRKIQL